MKRIFLSLIALAFAAGIGATALAAEKKKEEKKADPVAEACKGKKPGEEVTVEGKKVKCPAPKKKEEKKEEKKK